MNIKKTLIYCISFCLLFALATKAQTQNIPLSTLAEKKAKLANEFPYEKVHLQFDKPYYAVGDSIWFKAYVTTALNVPSPISKILYVELISDKDSLVSSLKLAVENSVTTGSFILPYPNFKEGNYRVRAFTKWMLNKDVDNFFSKNIYVGNALSKDLMTHINFDGTVNDKGQNVKTRIVYTDDSGKPLANKKVSWEVNADFQKIGRGKETTDANGVINIEFSSSNKVALNSGELKTSLEMGDKKVLNKNFSLKTATPENDIQFFPEGGLMLDGINTKVGFKAINSNGLGIAAKGIITNKSGKEVAKFNSEHLGMGSFNFIPEFGETYTANVTFGNQAQKNVVLPPVKNEGLALQTRIEADSLYIDIATTPDFLNKNRNQPFYIVAQNGGSLFYAAQSILRIAKYTIVIPTDKLPNGILQVSLLNTDYVPYSERLTFIERADLAKIAIKPELPSYKGRERIKINLETLNGLNPTNGNYSVSVINAAKVPFDLNKETTIYSNLLLTSDITGFVEQPNYYFNKLNTKRLTFLDNLLLTQGYRTFSYKDIAADKYPKISVLPEQGIDISGTIRKSNGMPLEGGRLLFQIPDKHYSTTATTDKEGRFNFRNLIFKDSSEVVINARNNVNSKDLRIMVDGESYPAITRNINSPANIINLDSFLNTYLKNSKIEHRGEFMLQEVVVKGTATVKKPSHADHSALSGLNMMADRQVQGDQLVGCAILTNCLTSAGLTFVDQQLFLTRSYNQGNRTPVEIYANGMPVDVNYLFSISPSGIESIEVFNTDGISGINQRTNTLGVVVINMKEIVKVKISKDQLKELFPPTNVLTFKPKGYDAERRFYVPKYSGPKTSLQVQDYRTTIYWNPVVLTDKNGKGSFEFYNSDDKGPYDVVIEGVDNSGNISRSVYQYQLK
ncbi:carboxypeptidase regulatory-like domain-containing protein [Pedobacter alpinus]|uniref:Carboxypeptidase regulatory-like domain-containing protein n=1 Tax=Pedobacter alpinus TaxID=1590643 RepID=A0ABW5TV04_9SPHI